MMLCIGEVVALLVDRSRFESWLGSIA